MVFGMAGKIEQFGMTGDIEVSIRVDFDIIGPGIQADVKFAGEFSRGNVPGKNMQGSADGGGQIKPISHQG
jgi:hypothetical protein